MTVNYTTNLALGQPVTGTESGTWGDDVNNSITSYLDIAIAGGLAITITTADVTLTNTQGTSSATNIGSTTAQYAILNISGAMTAARNLILPTLSRQYVINNNTTGGFALTVKGSATSGVTLVNGEKAHVFWNGSDYAKMSNASGGAGVFSSITNSGLTSGRVVYSTTGGLETDSAGLTFDGTNFATTGTATAAKLIPTGTSVTGNGMYLPATNSVGISTAGTNAVYIDASQNVGIGITPTDKLQVEGNIYLGTTSRTIYQGSSADLTLQVNTGNIKFLRANGGSESMRIASAAGGIGAVGIGYTSLTSVGDNGLAVIGNVLVGTNLWDSTNKLQVAGRIGATGFANTVGSYAALTASIQQGYPSYGFAQYLVVENAVNNSYGMAIYTTSVGTQAERMRIDSNGNLLVGTTASAGDITNTAPVVSGVFKTLSGTVSAATATATTIATLPNLTNGTYIVSCGLVAGDPTNYSAVSLVSVDATVLRITNLQTAALMSISISGQTVQATQVSGTTTLIYFTLSRFS